MKKSNLKYQTNQSCHLFLMTIIGVLFILAAFNSTFAQKGIGAKYGARDPRTCADTKSPASGAIAVAQATKYVICAQEHVASDLLYLVENMQVTVGGGRPYNSYSDSYATSIDTTAPVYPIRGSFDEYQCHIVSTYMDNARRNCTIYHQPKAEGKCYKTTFGDWYCNMQDTNNNESDIERDLPPPGGNSNASNRDNSTTVNNTQSAGTATDDDGYPEPDFSEMQKYFDISKYEYNTADGKLYFIAKMTKKNNAVDWKIDFYDEDGIKVIDTNGVTVVSGDYYEVGDLAKYYFYLPQESKMKRVKKVVITRRIY